MGDSNNSTQLNTHFICSFLKCVFKHLTFLINHADAIDALLAEVRPIRAIPGPIKPIDCRRNKEPKKGQESMNLSG